MIKGRRILSYLSIMDYLLAFNLMVRSWSLVPVIKTINVSGSLYAFNRFIHCLARPPSFLSSAEFNHIFLTHFCVRRTLLISAFPLRLPISPTAQIIQLSKIHSTNIDNYIKYRNLVNLNCKSRICTVDALLLLTLTFMTVKESSSF